MTSRRNPQRTVDCTFSPSSNSEFEGDPTPSNPAVSAGILRKILLVIVLAVEELRRIANLRSDRAPSGGREARLVSASRGFRSQTLCRIQRVDRRAVLGAEVVSLE